MIDKNQKLIKRRIGPRELDTVEFRHRELDARKRDIRLLERARRAWDNMDDVRRRRHRNVRFCFGDQWGDQITVWLDGSPKTMTMREYMSMDGQTPMQTNQVNSQIDTIVGILTKEQNEAVCNAIDRDEQQYAEILTMGLQANSNINRLPSLFRLSVKDVLLGGITAIKEDYGYRDFDQRRADSWSYYMDPDYMILETTMRDPRNWDMTMVGSWYRLPFNVLCARFVKAPGDYEKLRDIYAAQSTLFSESDAVQLTDQGGENCKEFMTPIMRNECCVAEIWTLETKRRIRLHDYNEGTLEVIDADDTAQIREIKAINAQRKAMAVGLGWAPDEVPLIEWEYFVDVFWYCKFLAPDGTVLYECESPYPDRLHPYTLMMSPFIDGIIQGRIVDAIDHNIVINRAIVLWDWALRNQIKGMVMIPKQLVPDELTNEEFVKSSMNMGNFFFYDAEKLKGVKPEVFHAGATNIDCTSFVQMVRSLMETSTSSSGTLQGKTPNSGTSAALYAQQTSNASTPIAAFLADVRTFMEDVSIKKAKYVAEFYDEKRWKEIAGGVDSILRNPNLKLNKIAYLEYDTIIKESSETPVYRAVANDYLVDFFKMNAISFEELLENADLPFADKILQKRQARQAEMQQAQDMAMVQGGQQPSSGSANVEVDNPIQTEQYGIPIKSTRPIVQ